VVEDTTPQRQPPSPEWEHYELFTRVAEVCEEIPAHFQSTISVSGVRVTEIYSFSAVLGLTIEQEVIRTLNSLRSRWDPNEKYAAYRFIRQPQNFPDVLLSDLHSTHIVMGIELKYWYLLAKESEPSFRYQVTPAVCAPQDVLVIVPWVLSNVLSGTHLVFTPFVSLARYIAEYRNYWWQHLRKAKSSTEIWSPEGVQPYPKKSDRIIDRPTSDAGNNFGRIARVGIIDEYVQQFRELELLGVEVYRWRRFLKEQAETDTPVSSEDFDIPNVQHNDSE
jgi:hypothetical protein